jgi:hypothetical protein
MKCGVNGCAAPAVAKGMCKYHYKSCKYGHTPRPTRGMTLTQRLEYYTDSSGGADSCWLWTGHTDSSGYGMIGVPEGGKKRVHRVRWALEHGDPGALQVLHSCDTPRCNNPRHLFLGTHRDSMADRDAKGRGNQPKGARAARSRLTEAQALRVRDGGEDPIALARELGVSKATIYHIRRKYTWRHLGDAP